MAKANFLTPGMNRHERAATADLVLEIHNAINSNDIAALDILSDKWLTLSRLEDLSVDAWEQVILANPLARAVRAKKEQLINYLVLEKQLLLEPPCDGKCSCRLCHILRSDIRFRQLYSDRILRALTSWHYVKAAQISDPIGKCLNVWAAIDRSPIYTCGSAESLRIDLRNRIQKSIVKCLDHTINEEEAILLLTDENDQFVVPPLPLPLTDVTRLINAEMKKAVAHPAVQALLTKCWKSGSLTGDVNVGPRFLLTIYNILAYFFVIPLTIVFPHPRLTRFLKAPATVYTNEAIGYWIFLIFVTATFLQNEKSSNYIICYPTSDSQHYFLSIIILSRVIRTCEGLWHFGRAFFTSPYEVLLCLSNFLYATGSVLLLISRHIVPHNAKVQEICTKLAFEIAPGSNITKANAISYLMQNPVSPCKAAEAFYDLGPDYVHFVNNAIEPHNLSAVFFAIGHLFYYLSAGNVLYMNRLVAHMNIAVTHMIIDVLRWALMMLLFYFAWALAMVSLYKYYSCENEAFASMKSSLLEMFWVLFAMTDTTDYQLSGKLKQADHRVTMLIEYTGFILYASYYIMAQIVLVNLLIALMSVTFQDIQDDRLTAFAFWRSKIQVKFIKWHRHSILPAPYNIFYPVYWLSSFLLDLCRRFRHQPSIQRKFSFEEGRYTDIFRQMFDRKLLD